MSITVSAEIFLVKCGLNKEDFKYINHTMDNITFLHIPTGRKVDMRY